MSVKAEKGQRKTCTVKAGSTNYSFDCLHPSPAVFKFLREVSGYATVEEEAERETKLRAFHSTLEESGQAGQQWMFGKMMAARTGGELREKFLALATRSRIHSLY